MVRQTPTGAHYGSRDWLAQRVTAIIMALYTLLMGAFGLWCRPENYADWKLMFSGNFIRIITMLFLLSLYYHAWVGVRDIFMDYIKPAGIRLTAHVAVILILLFYTVWSFSILWSA